jgi:hypothetical protein
MRLPTTLLGLALVALLFLGAYAETHRVPDQP